MPKAFTLNTGATIPWLSFGTGTALYKKDATTLVELVKVAIESNITHLDGAQMYLNEDSLGQGIKASGKPRSELFVTTKLNLKTLAPGESITQSLKTSLSKLNLEYVDLFLVHDPLPATKEGKLAEVWEGMEQVYHAGLAKAIGVSNFEIDDLKIILEDGKVVPAVNQIELHPYIWKIAQPLVRFCQEKGITIESYGGQTPLARVPGGPLDPILAQIRERLEKTRGRPVTIGQVLNKWLLYNNVVVVTTTSKLERIHELIQTEDVPDLTPEEVLAIEEGGSKLHKRVYRLYAYTT